MADLNPFLAVAIHCILFLTGSMGSVFIFMVYFKDWLKTRELHPGDMIISCIVICNVSLQGAILCNEICFFMFTVLFYEIVPTMAAIMVSLALSSLWCSTCLCLYYCVKIANVGGTLFYKLYARLPVILPFLLALSIAMSWMVGMPAYWDLHESALSNTSFTENATFKISFALKSRCNCLFTVYMFFSAAAFIIIFITAGTIIASLCRHMNHLKRRSDNLGHGNVSPHLSAARTVTSLLILYLAFYGALTFIFNKTSEIGTVRFSLCFIAVSTFPTINSVILIKGNIKLSNTIRGLLGMKPSNEPSEPNITSA